MISFSLQFSVIVAGINIHGWKYWCCDHWNEHCSHESCCATVLASPKVLWKCWANTSLVPSTCLVSSFANRSPSITSISMCQYGRAGWIAETVMSLSLPSPFSSSPFQAPSGVPSSLFIYKLVQYPVPQGIVEVPWPAPTTYLAWSCPPLVHVYPYGPIILVVVVVG